jgi:hypothetical protein
MKIRCNCCKERPVIDLGEPRHKQIVFCDCGKLLAAEKKGEIKSEWHLFDVFYDKEFNFKPVEIIEP